MLHKVQTSNTYKMCSKHVDTNMIYFTMTQRDTEIKRWSYITSYSIIDCGEFVFEEKKILTHNNYRVQPSMLIG